MSYMRVMDINRTALMRQNRGCTLFENFETEEVFFTKTRFSEVLGVVHEWYVYQSNRLDETKQRMYFSVDIFETEEVFCTKN